MTSDLARSERVRYHARWVVPVTAPTIENGTVVVEGDRIVWVGARNLAAHDDPARDEELGDVVLMPGLVNTHTHLDLTVMRGMLEGLSFFAWIRMLTAARAELSADELLDSARLGLIEGLRGGVTTIADTAPAPAAFDAMLELGVRGIAYQEVFGPDPRQCESSLDGLRRAVRAIRSRETAMVRVGVSPHAPYSVSDELFKAVSLFAIREGLPLATHVAESEDESDLIANAEGAFGAFLHGRKIEVKARGRSPIAMLERTGVLETDALLIHCIRVDAEDIRSIAEKGCGVAHCPASNAKLGHGVAPLRELLAAGVQVGLGSDSMASNNRMDLLDEARLAVLAQRMRSPGHDVLDARRALELATLGGARALGLGGVTGSLEPGKAADLAAFAIPVGRGPVQDPINALVWAHAGEPAARVIVAGVERVRDGVVLGSDVAALDARVQKSATRLSQWRRGR